MRKLLLISLFVLPIFAFGQLNVNLGSTLSSELNVEVIPNYPRPYETVSVNLTLYTGDLNSANITWYKDGKVAAEGKGLTQFSFINGAAGAQTTIKIEVDLLNGASFSKTFSLTPASIDMVWEADSYVPPFYKGKALHARQGRLKVVAMPEFIRNGSRIPASNLVYTWSNGVNVYQSQSGYGKNVLMLNGSLLGREEEIEVLVTDPTNGLGAEGFIIIPPTDPQIVFYKNDPYYGHIFETGISNTFDLAGEEVQIIAAPYFFTNENADNMQYAWRLNGQAVPSLSGFRNAVFKRPEGEGGTSNLSLNIQNTNRILQEASAALTIQFNEDE